MLREGFHLLPLADLNPEEWEALCDGCNLCCFKRSYNRDTGRNYYTGTFCILLKPEKSYDCCDYAHRSKIVPECQQLTLERLADPRWLPGSCAYRLRAEGKTLPASHPLFNK